MNSEKAYNEIVKILDDVVKGPDAGSVDSSPVAGSQESTSKESTSRSVSSVRAIDMPYRTASGRIIDPLASEESVTPKKSTPQKDLLTFSGNWKHEIEGFLHQLQISGEIDKCTRRGNIKLNGKSYNV